FGLETYPDEANFKKKMTLADKYVLEEDVNQNIIAYIILHKSRFNRGVRNADALIIVRPECMSPEVLETCLSLATSLARAARFRGLYVDTFASNTEVMKAVRGIPGFSEVAQLPSWTLDHSDVTSIIFYKELDIRTQCFQCCI
ncbi:protein SPT10 isoform X2, partial [Biomphalaria glabrata]